MSRKHYRIIAGALAVTRPTTATHAASDLAHAATAWRRVVDALVVKLAADNVRFSPTKFLAAAYAAHPGTSERFHEEG